MKWDQSFKTADKVFHDDEHERSEQCQISPAFIFSTEEIHFNLWIPKTRQLMLGFLWFFLNFCSSGWRNSSPIIEISTNFFLSRTFSHLCNHSGVLQRDREFHAMPIQWYLYNINTYMFSVNWQHKNKKQKRHKKLSILLPLPFVSKWEIFNITI